MWLHADRDSDNIADEGAQHFIALLNTRKFYLNLSNPMEGCAMPPVEILVPIFLFSLGIVVSVTLSGLGIERIIQEEKKSQQ